MDALVTGKNNVYKDASKGNNTPPPADTNKGNKPNPEPAKLHLINQTQMIIKQILLLRKRIMSTKEMQIRLIQIIQLIMKILHPRILL